MDSPDAKLWTSTQLDANAQKVSELLRARGVDPKASLPPLTAIEDKEKNELAERIAQWIRDHLPKFDLGAGGVSPDVIRLVVIGLIALVVASVFIFCGLMLWRLYAQTRKLQLGIGTANLPKLHDAESRLLQAWEEARRNGAWARAARLRWRLHLLRRQLPPSATPKETLKAEESVQRHYALMFSEPGAPAAAIYERIERELSPEELASRGTP